MTPAAKAQWQMHACVLLWGFTAILGKAITLGAMALVVWRMAIVCAALLLAARVWRGLRAMPARQWGIYSGIGALVALHWLTFYGAIKLANASVAVACIALATVFVPMVEPWLTGKRFDRRELLIGAAVVPGVALVVGGVPAGMHAGIVVGTISAVLVAFFGVLNKRYVEHADPLTVTFVELGAGTVVLLALTLLRELESDSLLRALAVYQRVAQQHPEQQWFPVLFNPSAIQQAVRTAMQQAGAIPAPVPTPVTVPTDTNDTTDHLHP